MDQPSKENVSKTDGSIITAWTMPNVRMESSA